MAPAGIATGATLAAGAVGVRAGALVVAGGLVGAGCGAAGAGVDPIAPEHETVAMIRIAAHILR
jgi:hypothetical protein